jgi:predicted nucleic acid-binding protein
MPPPLGPRARRSRRTRRSTSNTLSGALLAAAERLGVDHRLRGAHALYAATAARPGCPLLSWDGELIARVGAVSPRDWLAANPTAGDAPNWS